MAAFAGLGMTPDREGSSLLSYENIRDNLPEGFTVDDAMDAGWTKEQIQWLIKEHGNDRKYPSWYRLPVVSEEDMKKCQSQMSYHQNEFPGPHNFPRNVPASWEELEENELFGHAEVDLDIGVNYRKVKNENGAVEFLIKGASLSEMRSEFTRDKHHGFYVQRLGDYTPPGRSKLREAKCTFMNRFGTMDMIKDPVILESIVRGVTGDEHTVYHTNAGHYTDDNYIVMINKLTAHMDFEIQRALEKKNEMEVNEDVPDPVPVATEWDISDEELFGSIKSHFDNSQLPDISTDEGIAKISVEGVRECEQVEFHITDEKNDVVDVGYDIPQEEVVLEPDGEFETDGWAEFDHDYYGAIYCMKIGSLWYFSTKLKNAVISDLQRVNIHTDGDVMIICLGSEFVHELKDRWPKAVVVPYDKYLKGTGRDEGVSEWLAQYVERMVERFNVRDPYDYLEFMRCKEHGINNDNERCSIKRVSRLLSYHAWLDGKHFGDVYWGFDDDFDEKLVTERISFAFTNRIQGELFTSWRFNDHRFALRTSHDCSMVVRAEGLLKSDRKGISLPKFEAKFNGNELIKYCMKISPCSIVHVDFTVVERCKDCCKAYAVKECRPVKTLLKAEWVSAIMNGPTLQVLYYVGSGFCGSHKGGVQLQRAFYEAKFIHYEESVGMYSRGFLEYKDSVIQSIGSMDYAGRVVVEQRKPSN